MGRASTGPFAYVEHNDKLPNVLIYGDSISIAYTPGVRKLLDGKANVYRLHCNGGESATVIPKLKAMHASMQSHEFEGHWDFEWDVIHMNVGLHDLKLLEREQQTRQGKRQTACRP